MPFFFVSGTPSLSMRPLKDFSQTPTSFASSLNTDTKSARREDGIERENNPAEMLSVRCMLEESEEKWTKETIIQLGRWTGTPFVCSPFTCFWVWSTFACSPLTACGTGKASSIPGTSRSSNKLNIPWVCRKSLLTAARCQYTLRALQSAGSRHSPMFTRYQVSMIFFRRWRLGLDTGWQPAQSSPRR